MSETRVRTVASFTYPGASPAFVSIDEMSGDSFTVYIRSHANRLGVPGQTHAITLDGDSMREFAQELYISLWEPKK